MAREGFFAPGKRAVFIKPMNGHNMGKIVELKERFDKMDQSRVGSWIMLGDTWWYKGEHSMRVWIVESLGDPIVYYHNGTLTTRMVGPVPEYFLAPLDDFDQDEAIWIADAAPQQKHR